LAALRQNAAEAPQFTAVWGSSGESRFKPLEEDGWMTTRAYEAASGALDFGTQMDVSDDLKTIARKIAVAINGGNALTERNEIMMTVVACRVISGLSSADLRILAEHTADRELRESPMDQLEPTARPN
jgi:hypothetical protein